MLQYNKDFIIKPENIQQILNDATPEWEKRKKLYKMKTRKSSPSSLVAENDNKSKVAFESVISNMITGYAGGKAPVYLVNEIPTEEKQNILKKLFNKIFSKEATDRKEYQLYIDYIRDYNDDPFFYYKLVQDYNDMTAGYGIWYENQENEIVYANVDPRYSIALYDFSTPVRKIGFLRTWEESDANGNKYKVVQLTTDEYKYFFRNGNLEDKEYREQEELRESVNWGCVPCIAIENPDGLACFELAKSSICSYERVMSNAKNTFQYNDDAKLMVSGYEPKEDLVVEERDEEDNVIYDENGDIKWKLNSKRLKEDETLLRMPVFYAGEGGSIDWVEKNINDGALENYKKTLIDLIFMVSNCPNVNDLGFTNADNSSALEKKFFPLEQSITYLDKALRKELLAMWEAFTERINLKKGTKYDFRNLKINLQRNMPTDKKAETDRALSLRGLVCDETVINLLPDELDASSEIEKMKQQSQDNLEENMKKIESFGKDGADAQGMENNKEDGNTNDAKESNPQNATLNNNTNGNVNDKTKQDIKK